MAAGWNSGASSFANMRRQSNPWSGASSRSAGPIRGGARAPPSSGRGSRSGRRGAANSRSRVAE
eukprot:4638274-Alexandrium_andersonii.AAC.1